MFCDYGSSWTSILFSLHGTLGADMCYPSSENNRLAFQSYCLLWMRFESFAFAIELGLSLPHPPPNPSFPTCLNAVPLLQLLFMRLWFVCGICFCSYLFLISPSFGASGGVRIFMIVVFPGYILLYLLSFQST